MGSQQAAPRIGLLPTGHLIYWGQYPGLKQRGLSMYQRLVDGLSRYGEVVSPGLVDSGERAEEAAAMLGAADVDALLIFPLGYTTGTMIVPVV